MDSKKSRTSKIGREGISTSMWSATETVALAISPTNGLVFHSAFLGGMTGQRFNDFLTQARLNLDPNEHVVLIYDGAPANNNPAIPGPNSELKKLPPYSPFLNIVEQAIIALKAVKKLKDN